MRVGIILSPTGNWPAILEAAKLADESGLDSIGFWDHLGVTQLPGSEPGHAESDSDATDSAE